MSFRLLRLLALVACLPSLAAAGLPTFAAAGDDEITVENSSTDPRLGPRRFDAWERHSMYIPMSDGTRLAADVFRPTAGGKLHEEPLPLLWTHDRYQRSVLNRGQIFDKTRMPRVAESLRRGYVVAAVDVRGGGASFGNWTGAYNAR